MHIRWFYFWCINDLDLLHVLNSGFALVAEGILILQFQFALLTTNQVSCWTTHSLYLWVL